MGKKILLNTFITIMLFVSFLTMIFAFEAKNWLNVGGAAIVFIGLMIIKIMYMRNVHREFKRK
ncbi:DUF6358 family protein [Solitalea canadensis]|uniref:Uncharacterized protein n=1 Tax=Solitalea canadensis (strain ATCC 29591 / DSM 3403 / JCM 21819 / LMG 8368 / NBRC 15130 / NCIMB 12057 / USAM 9D) TaxID=929556 RepID=H8KSL5_SOLCM|nr:DUF6358 family protein [Solitalea canadensis]AFD08566.1 hypothetical protein Solca_3562 [Solitalea canadensis DSM 3403]